MAARFETATFVDEFRHKLLSPSFTVYNRLEALPYSDDLERSLGAEIRDPLWMLARQWQSGEFRGEDAGSPLIARLAYDQSRLTTITPGDSEEALPIDDRAPLEALVEAEPITDNLLLALRIGRLWLDGLKRVPALAGTLDWFVTNFPAGDAALPGRPANIRDARLAANARRQSWLHLATRRRQIDGLALIPRLRAGLGEGPTGLDAAARAELDDVAARFLAAHDAQFVTPMLDASAYQRSRFEYRFTLNTGAADPDRLVADQYDGRQLDWATFDRPVGEGRSDSEPLVRRFLPQPVRFPGMPVNRWWEFEDRRVDLSAVMAGRTDLAKLLMVEFGLVYGNDWFVVPIEAPIGSLVRVRGVVVRDDFGDDTFVPADDQLMAGGGTQASTLFALAGFQRDELPRESVLFIPPVAPTRMRGDPLDRVHLLRDEMANMAWAVEQTVPDRCGAGMDAHAAAERVRTLLDPASDDDPLRLRVSGFGSEAAIRWRLQTRVPDNWIPFVPVHFEGSAAHVRFQQAAMPWSATPTPEAKILPQGNILARNAGEMPFFIFEEEVPRAGAIVERAFARTRWTNGRTAVWLGREKRNGRGQGSSGLAFDGIVERIPE
jgi:hypothetical protein